MHIILASQHLQCYYFGPRHCHLFPTYCNGSKDDVSTTNSSSLYTTLKDFLHPHALSHVSLLLRTLQYIPISFTSNTNILPVTRNVLYNLVLWLLGRLNWVFYLWSHKSEIKVLVRLSSNLEALGRICFQAHSDNWHNLAPVVIGLRFPLPCWLSGGIHSSPRGHQDSWHVRSLNLQASTMISNSPHTQSSFYFLIFWYPLQT